MLIGRRIEVARREEIRPNELLRVEPGVGPVVLAEVAGRPVAFAGACTHEGWNLGDGFLFEGTVTCSLHGSRFDIVTGHVLDPPAEIALETYPVVVENGKVFHHGPTVRVSVGPPGSTRD